MEITCHDWYAQSDTYPTNSNTVAVNDSTPVLAPYNQNGTPEVMNLVVHKRYGYDQEFSILNIGR